MSIQREYIVICNEGVNIHDVEKELLSRKGNINIPSRSCSIAKKKQCNERITHFLLADDEAKALREDDRILDVHMKPVIGKSLLVSEENNYSRSNDLTTDKVNWGLARHIGINIDSNAQTNPYITQYKYNLTGRGVDVVIQDDGIEVDHPDLADQHGISRVRQIDWYVETGIDGSMPPNFYDTTTSDINYNGGQHGTMMASIIAGRTYGWAKEANIYSMRIFGGAGHEIDYTDSFDLIRIWHENKPIDPDTGFRRPTIVNQSWGFAYYYDNQPSSNPSIENIFYKGVDQGLSGGNQREVNAGMVYPVHPISVPSVNVEQQQLTDAGVICIHAAGNSYHPQTSSYPEYYTDIYESYYTRNDLWAGMIPAGESIYYNRAMSPNSRDTITVGEMSNNSIGINEVAGDKSERGPLIDVWAAGSDVVAATSISSTHPSTMAYPADPSRKIASMSGSSIATPQVTGMICLLAQMHPNITPSQCKAFVKRHSVDIMQDLGSSEDWANYNVTKNLYGATTDVLYWPYGTGNNVTISGNTDSNSTNFT
jgi:subtilisin family serine protease